MTDCIHALTVTLDQDYRADDVQQIVRAISMVKGVTHVATHVTSLSDHTARTRVAAMLQKQIHELFRDFWTGKLEEPDHNA